MPDSASNVLIKAYTDTMLMRAQQKESRTRDWCEIKDGVRGESISFDRVGLVEMTAKPSRFPPTPTSDPNMERRWAQLATYQNGIPIDRDDIQAMAYDPMNKFTSAQAAAVGRQWDRLVLGASLGTAVTGRVGEVGASLTGATGTETWPVTDRFSVSHVITETGTVGLTPTKVRQTKQMMDALQCENDRVFFIDSYGLYHLLGTVEYASQDYNTLKPLVDGALAVRWMGFEWRMVDQSLMKMGAVYTSVLSAVAMVRGAVGLGISLDKFVRISERADRSYEWESYVEMGGGAVRIDGERIVECQYYAG
jgi:hypothetical protein